MIKLIGQMEKCAWYRLAAVTLLFSLNAAANNDVVPPVCTGSVRIDCLPGNDSPSEQDCGNKGCCWQEDHPDIKCSYPSDYILYTVTSLHPHTRGVNAELTRHGPPSGFPNDFQSLALSVQYINQNMLRIRITDSQETRWQPPLPVINLDPLTRPQDKPDYTVKLRPDRASFQILRKSTNETILDTGVGGFIFSDQFIQLSTLLPTTNIYGIGEHHDNLNRGYKTTTYTLFNRGELVPAERTGFNLYGSHPFYLALEKSGNAHGVFLHNSNAMDIVVQPDNPSVTFRVIGGLLDFYVFLGPSGDDVVRQYTSLVGRPFLVPYWTLGFHLCRYGYNTTEGTRTTWKRNRDAGIPLDTMWSDIDYMDNMKDFTLSPTRMSNLKEFVQELHDQGVKYIMNNSPGLTGMEQPGSYTPVDEAKTLDIIIRDYKGDLLEAVVWQNVTYMLDFSNPLTKAYWEKYFKAFHEQALFDAAWIDMNEPYSFHLGSLNGCPDDNPLDYPPYVPGNQVLYNGTICLSSKQHLSTHYNLHTMYAIMETIAMNSALTNILDGRRPFVLTRASSPGLGFYGAHWSGDVHSSWEHLKYSVINMINFNMYGIPMIGTDICGFVKNTTKELCIRWMQVGAFYPFSRNHNDFDTNPQDPAYFDSATVALMKGMVEDRYKLLPFFYTHMYHSHLNGTPAVRPLFFDFPSDPQTLSIEDQFLWGQSLMVIPVLDENVTEVMGYLPPSVWYDYYTGTKYDSKGERVKFPTPIEHINVLVREGFVIPQQDPAQTTKLSRKNPFHLLVTLSKNGTASGDLYWDDGDSLDSVTKDKFNHIEFSLSQGNLKTTPSKKGFSTTMQLKSVTVYGLDSEVPSVTVNGNTTKHTFDNKVLKIDIPLISLLDENTISWH